MTSGCVGFRRETPITREIPSRDARMSTTDISAVIALAISTILAVVTVVERWDDRRKKRREAEAQGRGQEQQVDQAGMTGIRTEWKKLYDELTRQNAARLVQINKDREADRKWYEDRINEVERENREIRDEHRQCQRRLTAVEQVLRKNGLVVDDHGVQEEDTS